MGGKEECERLGEEKKEKKKKSKGLWSANQTLLL